MHSENPHSTTSKKTQLLEDPYTPPSNTFQYGENFHSLSSRLLFTKKVFTIILLQLTLNQITTILFFKFEFLQNFMINNIFIHYISFGLTILIIIILGGFPDISTKKPYNLILLFVFLFTTSYVMGYFTVFYEPLHMLIGSLLCYCSFFSVFVYCWVSEKDLSLVKAAFFVFGFCLAMTLGMLFFVYEKFWEILIGFGIAVVIAFYCVYEMQRILGNCEEEYSVEDYVYAYMSFYSDLVVSVIDVLIKLGNKG